MKDTKIEEIREEYFKAFPDPMEQKHGKGFCLYCSNCVKNMGANERADWWLQKLAEQRQEIAEETEDRIREVEMMEGIKRYNQAKEDGTLDKHFPKLN